MCVSDAERGQPRSELHHSHGAAEDEDRRLRNRDCRSPGCACRMPNVGNREANCIPVTEPRKMRTGVCVTEIAEFPDVRVGCRHFLPRGAAVSSPSRSQWQTRRMRPGAVVHNFKRHKKRASQVGFSENSHCNAGRDMNGKRLLALSFGHWLLTEN